MTKGEFLSSLKDIVNRAETKKEYLDTIIDDTRLLVEEFEEEE